MLGSSLPFLALFVVGTDGERCRTAPLFRRRPAGALFSWTGGLPCLYSARSVLAQRTAGIGRHKLRGGPRIPGHPVSTDHADVLVLPRRPAGHCPRPLSLPRPPRSAEDGSPLAEKPRPLPAVHRRLRRCLSPHRAT